MVPCSFTRLVHGHGFFLLVIVRASLSVKRYSMYVLETCQASRNCISTVEFVPFYSKASRKERQPRFRHRSRRFPPPAASRRRSEGIGWIGI